MFHAEEHQDDAEESAWRLLDGMLLDTGGTLVFTVRLGDAADPLRMRLISHGAVAFISLFAVAFNSLFSHAI